MKPAPALGFSGPLARATALLGLFVLLAVRPAAAHPPEFHGAVQVVNKQTIKGMPDYVYDPADVTVAAEVLDEPLWYDADVASRDGQLWYAWLDFQPGRGDRVWVGRRQQGKWTQRAALPGEPGDFAQPTLTLDAEGQLWLSYEAAHEDRWDVYAVRLEDGRPVGPAQRVSPAVGADLRHCACADPRGGIWIAWQSDNGGQFDIFARRMTAAAIEEPILVSDSLRGDWHPSAACTADGRLHVAWDNFTGESFDIRLRSIRDGKLGTVIAVTGSPAFEGRAQLAVDGEDRVWIAWEEGGENWGRPYRAKQGANHTDQIGPLHRFRKLHLALVEANGRVRPLADAVPQPSLPAAEHREETWSGIKWSGVFYERAQLATDPAGRLWIAYRHFYTPWLGLENRTHVENGWGVYARCLTDEGWGALHRFRIGQGDGLQRLQLAPHGGGIAAVWTTGRTHRSKSRRPRGIVTATIEGMGRPANETMELAASISSPARPTSMPAARPEPVSFGGQRYQLFFGDLHRHTDLSLCRVPTDGTIDDAYRYAAEVARLDFLGITDHSRDIAQGDPLSQLWWRSRKEVYRHELGTQFFPFYAYERSHDNTADHNVISLRGDMLRPHTYPVPEFWKEIDPATTITIPHQPIRRDTWKYQDDLRRPLVEIYQGGRDNAIVEDVHNGLNKGYHLGIIASSDHFSTSASYACVWAEDASREAIFQALKDRRTYGATANIRLLLRAGGHWMGEKFSTDTMPPVELSVQGTAPIRAVNFILDGHVARTLSPNQTELELTEQFDLTGPHYLYVHLIQADGNEAWSSPIWAEVRK